MLALSVDVLYVCVCEQIEQLEQKKEKRQRSVLFAVNRPFNGTLCPLSHGAKVCCCPPCMDEQRLIVQPGDQVLVFRWRKYDNLFLAGFVNTHIFGISL